MITFDNDNCLIILVTPKTMRRVTYSCLKKAIEEEILLYIFGNSNTITTEVIEKFFKVNRLKILTKNIKKYISNKKLCVNEEQILQVFFDKNLLVSFLIDLKGINRFLKTLTIKEMITLLGIQDFMKLDLKENYIYNKDYDKPEFYMKWKHV